MIRITGVEVKGLHTVLGNLIRLSRGLADRTDLFERHLEPDLYRTLSSEFQSEGSRAGGWAPLSPAYAARKAQEWPGRPILQRRRVLMRTLTVKGEPGQIRRLTTESMTLGTSHKAARFHQEGTRHMPARPPIALSRVDEERWLDLTREWVLRRAREAGLAT
ncbi:MAG TPA: hypothetical protein DCK83_08695 [Gallionellaceae bacterium]|nr:hypothetical protein [Gallionellaceae bacterium]